MNCCRGRIVRLSWVLFATINAVASAPAATLDGPIVEYAFKPSTAADEALIFTPPGFDKPGVPAQAEGANVAHVKVLVERRSRRGSRRLAA